MQMNLVNQKQFAQELKAVYKAFTKGYKPTNGFFSLCDLKIA